VTRAEKLWALYTRCVRANDGTLFHDHGRVLKRVFREPGAVQGVARPTKLTLVDVLKTWEWVAERTAPASDDGDAAEVIKEISEQISALWDQAADDLSFQSDQCVNLLADHLLVDIPRANRKRTNGHSRKREN
jgi:hypothetical protein